MTTARRRSIVLLLLIVTFLGAARAQYVLVNQAGYLLDQRKEAYVVGKVDSFRVITDHGGTIAFSGPVSLTSATDPATGLRTSKADFSALRAPGRYRMVSIPGDTSVPFAVADNALEGAYRASLKGYYYQRCGLALLPKYAGVYAHPVCHSHDAMFHASTGKTGFSASGGGWHDAGDYGKYVVNAGITVGTLLMAYEMFPGRFSQDDLNIPESGNGVPDILDEARYELDWLLEMQDTVDGGEYFKVTTEKFDGFEMPERDTSTRFIYQKSSAATGDFAAVSAQAARIFKGRDPAFARRCLVAAKTAWKYLELHPMLVPPMGFQNPPGTWTGGYGDWNDMDERWWAAVELFETTGERTYNDYFLNHYSKSGVFASAMSWPNVQTMAGIEYLVGKQNASDSSARADLRSRMVTLCSSLVHRASEDGLNVTLRTQDYVWGSNGIVLNNAVVLIVGNELTNDRSFVATALEQLNYILGCNCKSISFLTGVGAHAAMHIHHRPSAADGIDAPVPGLVAGGPNSWRADSVLQKEFPSGTPPAQCYVDDDRSYASNEICINWNAPIVFVTGYFSSAMDRR